MAVQKKRQNSIFLRIVLIIVAVVLMVQVFNLYSTLQDSKEKLANAKEKAATKQEEVDELQGLLDNGSDEEIVEKAAREQLGYVYPDEMIIKDGSGN